MQARVQGADLSFGLVKWSTPQRLLVLSCIKEFYFKFILKEKSVVKHSLAPRKSASSCCDVRCTGMASPGEGPGRKLRTALMEFSRWGGSAVPLGSLHWNLHTCCVQNYKAHTQSFSQDLVGGL